MSTTYKEQEIAGRKAKAAVRMEKRKSMKALGSIKKDRERSTMTATERVMAVCENEALRMKREAMRAKYNPDKMDTGDDV